MSIKIGLCNDDKTFNNNIVCQNFKFLENKKKKLQGNIFYRFKIIVKFLFIFFVSK